MNNQIKKWIYDYEDEQTTLTRDAMYIGTEEDFYEMKKTSEELWGTTFTNIRVKELTELEKKWAIWED